MGLRGRLSREVDVVRGRRASRGGTVPGQTACGSLTTCYDAGAIRLDNPTSSPVTIGRVSVDNHSSITGGKVYNDLWGSFTVDPGKSVILTENPPTSNPTYDNFD